MKVVIEAMAVETSGRIRCCLILAREQGNKILIILYKIMSIFTRNSYYKLQY